jgi:hypothetical protein
MARGMNLFSSGFWKPNIGERCAPGGDRALTGYVIGNRVREHRLNGGRHLEKVPLYQSIGIRRLLRQKESWEVAAGASIITAYAFIINCLQNIY